MKSVIVIGTGPDWKEESTSLVTSYPEADVMAVNAAIADSPVPITHAVSKHPDHLGDWLYKSEQNPLSHTIVDPVVLLPTGEPITNIQEYEFDYPWMEMTSGMFAVKVAIDLGYDKIYLAGLPLSLWDVSQRPGQAARNTMALHLSKVKDEFKNVIIPDHYWWKEHIKRSNDLLDL